MPKYRAEVIKLDLVLLGDGSIKTNQVKAE